MRSSEGTAIVAETALESENRLFEEMKTCGSHCQIYQKASRDIGERKHVLERFEQSSERKMEQVQPVTVFTKNSKNLHREQSAVRKANNEKRSIYDCDYAKPHRINHGIVVTRSMAAHKDCQ